ncbi:MULTISPECIES: AraC family transcriptional regulator [Asticcacaulis]|uniref:helix-turn-helix domain-containing protein n=1 Tax=Asticcacaulis TaxID=76890 RepID=UPI001AE4E440|nr:MULTISPECIES: helix-turn-helix transcriptional regulator [Asticcacaulis]MBP2157731.1 AraC-like DNA-binding protein [Asticcacaulis solisilvae]MDR6798776.1 AraC-like DNA-binding protein [Asticcacaulis sp. BE141]
MQEAVILITMAMALGQAALCLSLLLMRSRGPADLPLAAVFVAALMIALPQPVAELFPSAAPLFTALSLPAHLGMAPALWLYVEALTAETPWHPRRRHAWHAIPAALGVLALLCVIALPAAERDAMLVRGEMVPLPFALFTAVFIFALVLTWIGQTVAYGWRLLRRLARYRLRLMDLFANNDQRELRWVSVLVMIMAIIWGLALIQVILDSTINVALISPAWLHGLGLMAFWAFAVCGLRQSPGFAGRYLPEPETPAAPKTPQQKYQKSALGPEQARRVASRIEAAMREDRLFLDPNLSLQKLAAHIAVAPNTISQTLNETLGENFFAYVNRWRVEAAQPLIRTSDRTVLDIALEVGFNSKSAFYKAFKATTGVTPVQYKEKS